VDVSSTHGAQPDDEPDPELDPEPEPDPEPEVEPEPEPDPELDVEPDPGPDDPGFEPHPALAPRSPAMTTRGHSQTMRITPSL
jgi:hypothetical protein